MIEGAFAVVVATLSFLVAMAIPLFALRWRTLLIVVGVGTAFFAWMTVEVSVPGSIPSAIGTFLGGLMLLGFAGGAIARFVSLLGKRKEDNENGAPHSPLPPP